MQTVDHTVAFKKHKTSTQPFILIVDDNPTNLSVLSQVLKSANYKVRMAVDGEDALAQIDKAHPELILLDVQMPKINGFEACQRLQADPATQGIPIIFTTALADRDNKLKGLSLGAVDYVTKPFEPEEVLARVKIHWRLKRLTDSLEQQVSLRSDELKQAQVKLVHQEKSSALGQLVSGIAHEINNPIGCITGNLQSLNHNLEDLFGLLELYRQTFPQPGAEIEEEIESIDLSFLQEDMPKMLNSMKDAGNRIVSISKSIRIFSRADTDTKTAFNLNEGLVSTLLILRHRLKPNEQRPGIEVVTEYGDLPTINCFPGQLNQVFMNILANAIDALDEASKNRSFSDIKEYPYQITVTTTAENGQVKAVIADNGPGMPEAVKSRIFDHLFTTKEVGKGTGLGLAIAHQIIVEAHGGTIDVASELGQGTKFCIRLHL